MNKIPNKSEDRELCFVLMPFNNELEPVYKKIEEVVFIDHKLLCLRADNIYSTGIIIKEVWDNIQKAQIIIADGTGKNTNVFYEMGLAHAINKDIIIVTQTMDDIPFDLKHRRVILYNPNSLDEFKIKLSKTIESLKKNPIEITQWLNTNDGIRNDVHQAMMKIEELATRSGTHRQQEASRVALKECLESLNRIRNGEIRIPGREGGYFERFLECVGEAPTSEHIKAFIRLAAFEPKELIGKSWFENFYNKLDEAVLNGKLTIEYIFLIRTKVPTGPTKEFISRYKKFAKKIDYVYQKDQRLAPDTHHPSIVLFETQQIAFTHDRGDNTTLRETSEWIFQKHYKYLHAQFNSIKLISTPYFRKHN